MARHRLAALILALVATSGCDRALPQKLRVQGSATPQELADIRWAIDTANAELGPLVGFDPVIYDGLAPAHEMFSPDRFQDDVHVVYLARMPTDDYWLVRAELDDTPYTGTTHGYGTYSDIVLFTFAIPDIAYCLPCGRCGTVFRHVALHELGHFLGMGHTDDPSSVMSEQGNIVLSFNFTDRKAFCVYAPCVREP